MKVCNRYFVRGDYKDVARGEEDVLLLKFVEIELNVQCQQDKYNSNI